jgi:hypothetical protein
MWITYCVDWVHCQDIININGARFRAGSVSVLSLKIMFKTYSGGSDRPITLIELVQCVRGNEITDRRGTGHSL